VFLVPVGSGWSRFGSKPQPEIRYCIATASSRAPGPALQVERVRLVAIGQVEFGAAAA
jgi:hypothetical protein